MLCKQSRYTSYCGAECSNTQHFEVFVEFSSVGGHCDALAAFGHHSLLVRGRKVRIALDLEKQQPTLNFTARWRVMTLL